MKSWKLISCNEQVFAQVNYLVNCVHEGTNLHKPSPITILFSRKFSGEDYLAYFSKKIRSRSARRRECLTLTEINKSTSLSPVNIMVKGMKESVLILAATWDDGVVGGDFSWYKYTDAEI